MESMSVKRKTSGLPPGHGMKKRSIPLRELVMEALLSASSAGMVVSEIYEFVNSRCKEYDLSENKWKINVRNLLTTSVYFHCVARKERNGRRGRCWQFNPDAYNLHLQLKGSQGSSTNTPTEDIRRNVVRKIDEIPPTDPPASYSSSSNANIVTFQSAETNSYPTAPQRIYPFHRGNAWPSSDVIPAVLPQQMHTSSMFNQYPFHPIHSQQTPHYSSGTDFANAGRVYPVDHRSLQQGNCSGNSVTSVRRNYVNRFVPYDVRDSRNFAYITNPSGTPRNNPDTWSTQGRCFIQHPSQSSSFVPMNSAKASSFIAQAYPPIGAGESYLPQDLYSQTQFI